MHRIIAACARGKSAATASLLVLSSLYAFPSHAALPTATTLQPANIGLTSVTLKGTVNARLQTTTAGFEGTTSSGQTGSVPATPGTVTGSTTTAISASLSGMACGTSYSVRAVAVNASGTTRGSWVTFKTLACATTTLAPAATAPSATTQAASAVTASGATLAASVTSGSATATPSFELGTTTAYGTKVAASPTTLAASTTAAAVSGPASGLACGTTYHFRAKATSSAGSATGSDQVFTTAACAATAKAPTAITNPATVSANAATLNASVTPNGAATTVSFDWGTTTAYGGNLAASPASIAATAGGTSESAALSGLACATTYHFRVRAANAAGTTLGGDASLVTPACVVTQTPTAPTGAKAYHLAPTGSDTAAGSASAPWKTFAKAWSVLQAGDTLMVNDGSYSAVSPPAGKSGADGLPIVVQAVNAGGAVLDGLGLKGNAWLSFVGLRIAGSSVAVNLVSNGTGKPSHHNTFREVGFSCTAGVLNDSACFSLSDGSHHNLVEDSWGFGGGRYTVMCYGGPGGNPPNLTCDNNTFRRLVLRMGPAISSGGNPQASLALYYASGNVVENVVAIDGRAASDSSNSAFYITGHAPPPDADFNKYYGVIAYNNLGTGLYLDCPGAICNGTEIRNSVIWGAQKSGIAIAAGTGANESCANTIVDHNTVGRSGGYGFENYACSNATLTNNLFHGNGLAGARQSPSGGSTPVNHHNGYWNNAGGARSNLAAGTGDLTTDPFLFYLPRIEATSGYRNAGSPGDIGANVVNRYQDGVLTSAPLWPWPNEERLRDEMCAGGGAGFCTSGKSLTRYLWESLGNPAPSAF